jgi:CheY-like chemotaxis protein
MGSLGHTDPLRKDVEEIRKAGERAASLTRQLLAFSRKQVLMPRVLDLNTVLVDIDKLVRRLIGDDIKLTADLQPDLWRIKADPGQVEQVILNLVINARDAMPLGGELVTRTANEVIDAGIAGTRMGMKPGSFVHLSLSDTGCGMDPETLAHAFEPFFTTKEVGKGTGLGLSTAYGIIKQSGGYIYASSEVDYGTTVDIYLPAVETAAEGTADAGPEPATRRQEVILIVEDEEIVRSLYAKILRLRGYTVLEASNGREALSVAEGHPDPFQLLVTDIVMPEIGGRELALRLAPARPGMKVLYLSGYTDDTLALRRIQEAGAAFLLKPFSPDDLARKVHEILSQP